MTCPVCRIKFSRNNPQSWGHFWFASYCTGQGPIKQFIIHVLDIFIAVFDILITSFLICILWMEFFSVMVNIIFSCHKTNGPSITAQLFLGYESVWFIAIFPPKHIHKVFIRCPECHIHAPAIESLNSTYRRLNLQKNVLPSNTALLKALYLALSKQLKDGRLPSRTGLRSMENWVLCIRGGLQNKRP